MSAKDNFAQAFKELLSGSDADSSTEAKPAAADAEPRVAAADSVNISPAAAPARSYEPAAVPAPVAEPAPTQAPVRDKSAGFGGFAGFGRKTGSDSYAQSSSESGYSTNNMSGLGGFTQNPGSMPDYAPPAGVTTIANGTMVIGEIHSKGDMNLYGEIKGNVETTGNIILGGRVMGNIVGNDMTISSSAVKGNVAAAGAMTIDNGSVVLGDLKAREAQFDGQVKGNLTVEGLAHFLADTVLLGNVTVGSLIVDEGARLRGEICTGSRDRFDITDPFQG